MDYIIITLAEKNKRWSYDIELPKNVPFAKLKSDIVEAINSIEPDLLTANSKFFFNRLGRYLGPDESISDAGVWNGDMVTAK